MRRFIPFVCLIACAPEPPARLVENPETPRNTTPTIAPAAPEKGSLEVSWRVPGTSNGDVCTAEGITFFDVELIDRAGKIDYGPGIICDAGVWATSGSFHDIWRETTHCLSPHTAACRSRGR